MDNFDCCCTGDKPGKGRYCCNNCNTCLDLDSIDKCPPCPSCGNTDFQKVTNIFIL